MCSVSCVCPACGGPWGFGWVFPWVWFPSPVRVFPLFPPFEGLSFEHTRRMCPRHGASDAHSYGLRVCTEHGAPYVQHHRRHSYASSLWDKSFHILLQCQGIAPATAHLPMVRGESLLISRSMALLLRQQRNTSCWERLPLWCTLIQVWGMELHEHLLTT